jgi:hypothetical protein
MHIKGKLVIGVDGAVVSVDLGTDRLTPSLHDALLAKVRGWRFKPLRVKGTPVQAATGFHLVLAAVQQGEGYDVRVDGAYFGDPEDATAVLPDGTAAPITGRKLTPPKYPAELQRRGRTGKVHLAVLVRANGTVEDVQVLQSLAYDFEEQLGDDTSRSIMRSLEANAIAAARRWTFDVPPARVAAGPSERTVIVPVVYLLQYNVSLPGVWFPVRRGPERPVAWLPPERSKGLALSGRGAGSPSPLDSPYQILQPATGTLLP